ncbi:SMI1/KNR4 family protein [Nocardioides eburneiflavus]|uniref:SMI1/KNR4 family protein n=1 Tax=Nocardioides eburneiflavus TaxID=2518372 RepID=UPI001B2FFB3E|nr:SMI1/KNR4 family protein [Nocardioides eburneiflavus]
MGSRFWLEEWGYPDIGVYFADCPSAGHDMLALDYSGSGEPRVVHVDQELDYAITVVAPDFAAFVSGLTDEGEFDVGW